MRYLKIVAFLIAVPLLTMPMRGASDENELRAALRGFNEVPATFSTASGEFRGTITADDASIVFTLNYEGFDPTSTVTAAHIHVGQAGVNGNVTVFLCGGGGRPACTSPGGTFRGTITSSNVIALPGQGIVGSPAQRFARLLAAIRAGVTYVNVHSGPDHLGGEIRGQIRTDDDD